jgi:predicted N-acyltransferase
MDHKPDCVVHVHDTIASIPAAAWDACANPDPARRNPFLGHAFLKALEDSGCVGARKGWVPQHLAIQKPEGGIAGVMPLYLKSHSRGEYVFDYGWADAFERAGGSYYPKLQACVPFTPVTGRRLLIPDGEDRGYIGALLMKAATELVRLHEASSLHLTFLTEEEWREHGEAPFLRRTDRQFHWINQGFASFDDFLGVLASRKRKALKKERREAVAAGITIEHVTGAAITEAHWDAFFSFYQDTGGRKWGTPYLNRRFFSMIGETMRDDLLLIMCSRSGTMIAGALNVIGGDTLYGRYWGCVENHPFLHFETCYYQAIDFAIARGLARVEAGAQGEHKLARGYVPQITHSLHYLAHPALRRAVAQFLEQEREAVEEEARYLTELTPFRRDGGDAPEDGCET